MRKRAISDEELSAIINLVERGASWLKIERDTDIPRAVAKRAYDKWEQNRSLEELKKVRFNIAGEEFRDHLKQLARIAESLPDFLHIPASPYETQRSEELLDKWLQSFILEDSQDLTPEITTDIPSETAPDREERRKKRVLRDNKLLFKCLQAHTVKSVRWKRLEEWKQEWDRCVPDLVEMRKEAGELLNNILSQKAEIAKRIVQESGEKDAREKLLKAVLDAVWRSIESDDMDEAPNFIRIGSYGGGYTPVIVGKSRPYTVFSFKDGGLAKEVLKICRQAITILSKGDTCIRVRLEVVTMRYKITELEGELSPLKLKPVLLKTRCELCPV